MADRRVAGTLAGLKAAAMTPRSTRTHAIIMLLLATFYWGLSFSAVKSVTMLSGTLVPGAGTWFLALSVLAPRFLVAALLMGVLHGRGGASASELRQGIVLGLFASAGMLLQTDGLQFTSASTSAFLTQFSAILIPVWLAVRARRGPGPAVWAGCLLVLTGVAVLARVDVRAFRLGRGEWETLLSSIFFSGQILTIEGRGYAANRPAAVTLVMFSTVGAVFAALAVAAAPSAAALAVPWTSPAWLILTAVVSVVCTLGAFSLMNAWQPKISPTEAGLIYCAEPLFASLFALFLPALLSRLSGVDYPDEHATGSLIVGGSLITLANVLVQGRAKAA